MASVKDRNSVMSNPENNSEVTAAEATPVDVTEDLDAFSKTFFGGDAEEAAEKPETPPVEDAPVDEAPTVEDDEDDPLATEDDDQKPEIKITGKKKSAKERINELTARAREAERREEDLRRELEEARRNQNKADEPKVVKTEASDGPSPDAVDADGNAVYPLGEFDPNFVRDFMQYQFQKEREAEKARAEQERAKEQADAAKSELINSWEDKLVTAEKALPDLREKAEVLQEAFQSLDPAYGEHLAMTLMSLDNGPEVMYYLSENVSEAKKIVNMGAMGATLALGRLDAALAPKREEPAPKTSNAPDPAPLNKGSAPKVDVSDDTDDLEAFSKKFFKKR